MEKDTLRSMRNSAKRATESKRQKHQKERRGRGRPPVFSREEIVNAARIAFGKDGYANVTLDHLAAQLNTGKGTLYYHASRKVHLLVAISREIIEETIDDLRRIASMDAPAEVRLELAIRSHMRAILADVLSAKIYFENESDLPPKIKVELRKVLRQIQDRFVAIIADGVEEGVFKGDPSITVKHLMAVCNWPYRWYSASGSLSIERFIDTAIEFIMSAVLVKKQSMVKLNRSRRKQIYKTPKKGTASGSSKAKVS